MGLTTKGEPTRKIHVRMTIENVKDNSRSVSALCLLMSVYMSLFRKRSRLSMNMLFSLLDD